MGLGILWKRQPAFAFWGFFMLLSVPVLFALIQVDDRMIDGINVWVKPFKFSISLGLYSLTLAFFVPWMRTGAPETKVFRFVVALFFVAMVFETAWLWSASYLGIRSHFNIDGGLFTLLYPLSGLFAFVLVMTGGLMGISVLRGRRFRKDPALTTAIGWGLILTFVLTPLVAFPLSNPMENLGGSKNGYGDGFFGWRMLGGDLRAAHFFATHAVHAVPLFGWLVSRVLPNSLGVMIVRLGAAAWAVFVLTLAYSTFQGQNLPAIFTQPF